MNMKQIVSSIFLSLALTSCGQDNASEREGKANGQSQEVTTNKDGAEAEAVQTGAGNGGQTSEQAGQTNGRCLCGPCGTTGAAAPLALDVTGQEFRVTIRFSAPVASLTGKFLTGSVAGELKEPKYDPARPCVPPMEEDALSVFDLSSAQVEITRQSAEGILEVSVQAKAPVSREFYDSLVAAKFSVSIQHEEASAAEGMMNRYHDAGGEVLLTGFEQSAYELVVEVDTSGLLPVNDPKE